MSEIDRICSISFLDNEVRYGGRQLHLDMVIKFINFCCCRCRYAIRNDSHDRMAKNSDFELENLCRIVNDDDNVHFWLIFHESNLIEFRVPSVRDSKKINLNENYKIISYRAKNTQNYWNIEHGFQLLKLGEFAPDQLLNDVWTIDGGSCSVYYREGNVIHVEYLMRAFCNNNSARYYIFEEQLEDLRESHMVDEPSQGNLSKNVALNVVADVWKFWKSKYEYRPNPSEPHELKEMTLDCIAIMGFSTSEGISLPSSISMLFSNFVDYPRYNRFYLYRDNSNFIVKSFNPLENHKMKLEMPNNGYLSFDRSQYLTQIHDKKFEYHYDSSLNETLLELKSMFESLFPSINIATNLTSYLKKEPLRIEGWIKLFVKSNVGDGELSCFDVCQVTKYDGLSMSKYWVPFQYLSEYQDKKSLIDDVSNVISRMPNPFKIKNITKIKWKHSFSVSSTTSNIVSEFQLASVVVFGDHIDVAFKSFPAGDYKTIDKFRWMSTSLEARPWSTRHQRCKDDVFSFDRRGFPELDEDDFHGWNDDNGVDKLKMAVNANMKNVELRCNVDAQTVQQLNQLDNDEWKLMYEDLLIDAEIVSMINGECGCLQLMDDETCKFYARCSAYAYRLRRYRLTWIDDKMVKNESSVWIPVEWKMEPKKHRNDIKLRDAAHWDIYFPRCSFLKQYYCLSIPPDVAPGFVCDGVYGSIENELVNCFNNLGIFETVQVNEPANRLLLLCRSKQSVLWGFQEWMKACIAVIESTICDKIESFGRGWNRKCGIDDDCKEEAFGMDEALTVFVNRHSPLAMGQFNMLIDSMEANMELPDINDFIELSNCQSIDSFGRLMRYVVELFVKIRLFRDPVILMDSSCVGKVVTFDSKYCCSLYGKDHTPKNLCIMLTPIIFTIKNRDSYLNSSKKEIKAEVDCVNRKSFVLELWS